ncbi:Exoglucanase 1 [Phytophthora megakarya]|uniref:cellulose 1,4-beta-cellobiosidase (non-reducing end) n=1 Tax=Phytophthora megakarya TaxID=4795 RepID=A0A225UXR7_9STRA|nr:Exoglucanase 1 [Phytophthora megakarya]
MSGNTVVLIRRLFNLDDRVVPVPDSVWDGLTGANSIIDSMCETSKKLFGDQNDYAAKGGLERMDKLMANGMTLAMSLWSNHAVYCLWLDTVNYPADADSLKPRVKSGMCPTSGGRRAEVVAQHPGATVK